MAIENLFTTALGLSNPWYVKDIRFNAKDMRLNLFIDFQQKKYFKCPICGQEKCPVNDIQKKTWQHLNFFQHQSFLTVHVPYISCPDCGVNQVQIPWARDDSIFTLPFEILILHPA